VNVDRADGLLDAIDALDIVYYRTGEASPWARDGGGMTISSSRAGQARDECPHPEWWHSDDDESSSR
jgi:hypothetical protein